MEQPSYEGLVAAFVAGKIIAALFAVGICLFAAGVVIKAHDWILDAIDRW